MWWIKNTITGTAIVNRCLHTLYFYDYREAYKFIKHKNLNENTYHIMLFGAIVPRGTMGMGGKK